MKPLVPVLIAALLTGCGAPMSTSPAMVGTAAEQAESVTAMAKAEANATTLSTASCPGPMGVVSGLVRDQDGHPLADGATVRVSTTGDAAPFTLKVVSMGGVYVLSQVPLGVPLVVQVTGKTGFVRTRTLTLVGEGCDENDAVRAELNFGGPATANDPQGNLFYLPSK
jgi:hypothetical protein